MPDGRSDMTPLTAISAVEQLPEIAREAESTLREIAHEFGFTSEEDFVGLAEFLLLLYATVYPTMHNLSVLIRQAQLYLDQLGGEIKQAEQDVSSGLGGLRQYQGPRPVIPL